MIMIMKLMAGQWAALWLIKNIKIKGMVKKVVLSVLTYFKKNHNAEKLYICVSSENIIARKMFAATGFIETKQVEYTF